MKPNTTKTLTAITLTKVVLPEYWSPTRVNSISSFQKRLLNQSKILFINANILHYVNQYGCLKMGTFLLAYKFNITTTQPYPTNVKFMSKNNKVLQNNFLLATSSREIHYYNCSLHHRVFRHIVYLCLSLDTKLLTNELF